MLTAWTESIIEPIKEIDGIKDTAAELDKDKEVSEEEPKLIANTRNVKHLPFKHSMDVKVLWIHRSGP